MSFKILWIRIFGRELQVNGDLRLMTDQLLDNFDGVIAILHYSFLNYNNQ